LFPFQVQKLVPATLAAEVTPERNVISPSELAGKAAAAAAPPLGVPPPGAASERETPPPRAKAGEPQKKPKTFASRSQERLTRLKIYQSLLISMLIISVKFAP